MNSMSGAVVDSAMTVHSALGAGLLESAYQACLAYELQQRGLQTRTQVPLPVMYKTIKIELAYRIDLLVENQLVVEIKTVNKLLPVHKAQLLSYLKLGGFHAGLLINFNVPHLRHGIKRIAN
jgi:GxxExxY protein